MIKAGGPASAAAIPTIGFRPAREQDAHSTNDRVTIDDLVSSIAFYAALPSAILETQ